MNRNESIIKLQAETFDLCIIGGGASGAGCALDAALRGLKVALVEKDDFAAGTSSKSTKLIHGGVRYLEQAFKKLDAGQLRQVRHGLLERHTVLANAPHLARPLALVTPVFNWRQALYFRVGLWLYDRFAVSADVLPASRWISRAEALRLLPGLSGRLHSAVLYYDGQLDDARYCLALVQSAAAAGAVVANHLDLLDFEKNNGGRITGARVQDVLGDGARPAFPVRARCFLNCTGPQADRIRRLANPGLSPRIRPSKGVHVMLPLAVLGSPDTALLIPQTPDGRVVFAIPFQGRLLLGTTDQGYPTPDLEPVLETPELDFLLQTLQPYVRQPVTAVHLTAGFGGLRPLLASPAKPTKGLVRDHEVEYEPHSGLFSLLGGKWTTYRLMARDAVDAVCRRLGADAPCGTATHRLAGAANDTPGIEQDLRTQWALPEDVARHLAANYGSRATQVAQLARDNPDLAGRLLPAYPYLRAEVVYAIRLEMACTLRDVLARRIRMEITDWAATLAAAPAAARLMARELNWTPEIETRETGQYVRLIQSFQQAAGFPLAG
ncbi:MAG: FAD-dependent oxidoreductase [Saprospirales bacterium]|nr:FAD-dependent oxidoreductase [Saprospirales bacterium]